jgi:hypothetical protein
LKGGFQNHNDEIDTERLQQLFQGARKDAEFIINKVRGKVLAVPASAILSSVILLTFITMHAQYVGGGAKRTPGQF